MVKAAPPAPQGRSLRNTSETQSTSKSPLGGDLEGQQVLPLGEDLGGAALLEFKPNKQPIGKFDNVQPFANHKIDIQKGDTIYLFTDGYADQFGGPRGKKLGKTRFKEIVLTMQHLSMDEQRKNLLDFHLNWRGTQEQVDDICVIGVRV